MMREDIDGVGGFFEDLPVLAFVLAGVLSVAGTACWTAESRSAGDALEGLEACADLLVADVVAELTRSSPTPSTESIRRTNLSVPFGHMAEGTAGVVSVWCVHPGSEPLLVASTGDSEPCDACSDRALMNALREDGTVCVVEVRALVWEALPG
jgi:hypothetical protein